MRPEWRGQVDVLRGLSQAGRIRGELIARRESFVFETVLSDPVGAKVARMGEWQAKGHAVVMCFIGLSSTALSDQRVSIRVSQGGHDVPPDKIKSRFPRTLKNLQRAIDALEHVLVYDNSDLRLPYRYLARFEAGKGTHLEPNLPTWFKRLRKKSG